MTDDAKQDGLPIALRVTIGVLLVGAMLVVIGALTLPRLMFPEDRPAAEPILATEANAGALAERLTFSMSDQEITETVLQQPGAVFVELRHDAEITRVLVSVPDSIVEPRTHTCYQFTLLQHKDVAYEEAPGCPDVS
ncbi:hypothetical protein [Actinophytocola glycyrrhizae]|uniref:Uncharacterized protein n=1 Tax=Actinophytocola glycyrrhizae TaxID=2044873 RepID=A0ABV9SFJ0_9PSEU